MQVGENLITNEGWMEWTAIDRIVETDATWTSVGYTDITELNTDKAYGNVTEHKRFDIGYDEIEY